MSHVILVVLVCAEIVCVFSAIRNHARNEDADVYSG